MINVGEDDVGNYALIIMNEDKAQSPTVRQIMGEIEEEAKSDNNKTVKTRTRFYRFGIFLSTRQFKHSNSRMQSGSMEKVCRRRRGIGTRGMLEIVADVKETFNFLSC